MLFRFLSGKIQFLLYSKKEEIQWRRLLNYTSTQFFKQPERILQSAQCYEIAQSTF